MTDDPKEPQLGDFSYLDNTALEGWAWEYVRRSPQYREAWREHNANSAAQRDGSKTIRVNEEETKKAAKYGLLFFRRS